MALWHICGTFVAHRDRSTACSKYSGSIPQERTGWSVAVTVTAPGCPEHSDTRPSAQAARAPGPSLARHRSCAKSLSRVSCSRHAGIAGPFRIPKLTVRFRCLTRSTVNSAAERSNQVQFSSLRQAPLCAAHLQPSRVHPSRSSTGMPWPP